jgi:hypothetical protein
MQHFGAEPDDVRQAYVFPPSLDGRGEFTLIEDDGVTLNYQRGEFAEVRLEVIAERNSIELLAESHGDFVLPYARIEFILPERETRVVRSQGETRVDARGRRHVEIGVKRR